MTDILVVEDDEAIANLICVSLSAEGYRCTCARDGMEGADYIERQSFDLVLLDIAMPKMNGMETFERMKADNLDIPVIFLTASGYEDDVRSAIKLGAVNYLKKPFYPNELVKRVAKELEER